MMQEPMHECKHNPGFMRDTLVPQVGIITDIRTETPDVKTFRVEALGGGKLFEHMPGQCAMICVPGVSEAMFSITSSPTVKDYQEFSIKKCGCLTDWLHQAEVGQQITVRGPYGNAFPVDDEFAGKDLLFIAGGIGNRIDYLVPGLGPHHPVGNIAVIIILGSKAFLHVGGIGKGVCIGVCHQSDRRGEAVHNVDPAVGCAGVVAVLGGVAQQVTAHHIAVHCVFDLHRNSFWLGIAMRAAENSGCPFFCIGLAVFQCDL